MPKKVYLAAAVLLVSVSWFLAPTARPQQREPDSAVEALKQRLSQLEDALNMAHEAQTRSLDDLTLFHRLEDVAEVDKVRYTGPPPRVIKNPTAPGASNPVIVTAYTFIPRKRPANKKLPLMVLVHGGIHGNLDASYVHVLRELIAEGYAVIAPEYRGSSGYGKEYWQLIDYGGLENEDVFAGKLWMLEAHSFIDPARVGIMGWSHGGMITLMNLFAHPQDYKVGYAAVPVCDLIARMGYRGGGYQGLFAAPYHIGKTVDEDPAEYRRRSPAWNAEKLKTPLLIHTTTNDEDVNVLEVENLIKALKAAGKPFEHKIYNDAPGGHEFSRIDTRLAREARAEAYKYMAKFLK